MSLFWGLFILRNTVSCSNGEISYEYVSKAQELSTFKDGKILLACLVGRLQCIWNTHNDFTALTCTRSEDTHPFIGFHCTFGASHSVAQLDKSVYFHHLSVCLFECCALCPALLPVVFNPGYGWKVNNRRLIRRRLLVLATCSAAKF